MKKHMLFIILLLIGLVFPANSQTVQIQYNVSVPQAKYAAGVLQKSLEKKGYTIKEKQADYVIDIIVNTDDLTAESYTILPENKKIIIKGGDGRGVIYGCLSLAEDLRNGIILQNIRPRTEAPRLSFRTIKFDLPWDTYRHSHALNLHQETCRDLNYWEVFLDMMAENRFNTLTLWNLHPYPFMIRPKNFPEACPFNDEEMKKWTKLFSGIFRMARERGIDTYMVPFNIFVSPEFSRAHNVAMDNLDHEHFVKGDTSEIIKRYTRECVTQILQDYPELTGMGLTLGEGMGGMTPQERENWMQETIIKGMSLAGRRSKLIHRIPFSSTTGSLGPTSIETEQITREGIEKEGELDFIEGPVWADLKFNWSHAHSTTKLIKVHGGKLYGTYFYPEPKNYKIVWTARNEDFFCLRWGVPDFIREHINSNAHSYVGGYIIGSETYIPAKDYFTKPGIKVSWKYAFQRQWLFYKLWGRLLYNPATPDSVFKEEFIRRYDKKAGILLEASSLAGKTPLRLASSFDCGWDFTLYSEGFMALNNETSRVEYISVDRQINQPPLDTNYISVKEYVKGIESGKSIVSDKITPPILTQMLHQDCTKALDLIKKIKNSNNNDLIQEVADIKVWANMGLYFAEKLKGAVALETYRVIGGEENKQAAVKHLERALKFWDIVIGITRPIYNDMPLVHYSSQDGKNWKENVHLRFHWEKLRSEVAKDIEIAKNCRRN
ncbi:MAG: hypothetical protein JXA06_09005 [Bacteroidetes bacterium]|nr:hypothetical protein [Bacteroidota bacterium]